VHGWACSYSRFTSAELEAITGIPGPMQRLWRSRSQLPGEIATRAAFTTRDVAEILVRYDLSKLGVPPGASSALGASAAQTIMWYALLNADGAVEVSGSERCTASFLERFDEGDGLPNLLCQCPNKLRYLVKSSTADVPEFCSDLSQFIDSKAARSGAFLDLEGAASDLSERARRPLLRVDVGAHIGERRIRRLTMVVRPSLQLV
jgi:hypothetical protein